MVHLGFWLPLLAFPMVGAVLQTIQLRQTIIANCDLIFSVTSNPLCLNDTFINACSNFFVMAEICRWTRCNFVPQYPDFALLEVVEFSDIAGYQQLVNFCGANNVPLCLFARVMLQLAQQRNSVAACPQTGAILCVQPGLCTPLSQIPNRSCPIAGTVCCIALPTTAMTTTTPTTGTLD
ncbi:uncharacterized protein [Haliotis cracherodii]|uniref:uncharacterized protein n=1 Tax=Haliotis cracherodii TaxID=6455 RepID=UPI0039ED9769